MVVLGVYDFLAAASKGQFSEPRFQERVFVSLDLSCPAGEISDQRSSHPGLELPFHLGLWA
jgi:hypothetical protein